MTSFTQSKYKVGTELINTTYWANSVWTDISRSLRKFSVKLYLMWALFSKKNSSSVLSKHYKIWDLIAWSKNWEEYAIEGVQTVHISQIFSLIESNRSVDSHTNTMCTVLKDNAGCILTTASVVLLYRYFVFIKNRATWYSTDFL